MSAAAFLQLPELIVTEYHQLVLAEEAAAKRYRQAASRHARAVEMYDQAIDEVTYKELQLYWQNVEVTAAEMSRTWHEWDDAKTQLLAVQS